MRQIATISTSLIGLTILLFACGRSKSKAEPDPLAQEPHVIPLNLDSGYVFNPVTGDSTNNEFEITTSGKWTKWDYFVPPADSLLPPKISPIKPDSMVILEPDSYKLGAPMDGGEAMHELTDIQAEKHYFICNSVKAEHPKPIPAKEIGRGYQRTRDIRLLDVEHGLPGGRVWAADDDANGDIWMAQWEVGAVRYDGNNLFVYTEDEGLPGTDVREFHSSPNGDLWIGSAQGGLTRFDGEYFHNYTYGDINVDRYYTQHIYEDSKGDIWMGGLGEGMGKLKGDTLYQYQFNEKDQINNVQCSYLDSKDRLWAIAGGNQIYRVEGDKVYQIADLTSLGLRPISGLVETAEDEFWFETVDGHLLNLSDNRFTYYSLKSRSGLTNPLLDGDCIWYAAGQDGLMQFNYKTLEVSYITNDDGLPENGLLRLSKGPDGSILMGTLSAGLGIYYPNSWKHVIGKDFPVLNVHSPYLLDSDGSSWRASGKGVAHIIGDTLFHYRSNKDERRPLGAVAQIVQDKRGQNWFISRDVFRIENDQMVYYGAEQGIGHEWCRAALAHSDSSMWIGAYATGITVFAEDEVKYIDRRNGLISPMILAFLQDSKDRVWAGTYMGGLSLFDGDSLITYTEKEGLPGNDIRALAEDEFGNIWIGFNGAGVCRFDGKEFLVYNDENGLSGNLVEEIKVDHDGNVWVGSRTGLNYFRYDSTVHENHVPQTVQFDLSDGLSDKVTSYLGSWIDSNNVLHWGFDKVRSELDLNRANLIQDPPTATITNVIVDDEYISFNSDSADHPGINYSKSQLSYNTPEDLVLDYDRAKLRLDFKPSNLAIAERTVYSTYLEGLDHEWNSASELSYVEYQHIGYGDFTLHIRAAGPSGIWGEETTFSFQVLPPWYHTTLARIVYAVLFFGLLFLLFKWRTARLIAKQKELEIQIDDATQEIRHQHEEIMDSIAYAKRIQSAILPPKKLVKEYLQDSFILYKPKDVVAGDFYWMDHKGGEVLFAAADCTGHGVPGAMVSVICNGGLNRSVNEFGLSDPGQILDKTRELVIKEFEKSEDEVKDGMDIALCSLNGRTLKYSGAHNPLWIIRKGSDEVEQIKADKQPIGKYADEKPFTTHSIELQAGDTFYLFSDGYADQFGGEKGKKFKGANFRRLLLSIQNESMERQMELIDQKFEEWRGSLEQVDDVCVIGVRL